METLPLGGAERRTGQGLGWERTVPRPGRGPGPPHRAPAVAGGKHPRVSNEAGLSGVEEAHLPGSSPQVVTHIWNTKASNAPWPTAKLTTGQTEHSSYSVRSALWEDIGTQAFATCAPSPSTSLGGIPPPQVGHKFSDSTETGTHQGHLTAGDAV